MRSMRVIFTKHALRRMKERNVSAKEVHEALLNPDRPYELGKIGDEEIAVKRFGRKEVRVVFEEKKAGELIVYTVIVKWLR
ncbi:MAG: DUF4258 domain-containing protein [Armatimonadetes bacterium]|nr:DUF4258 domain-containing protein [Armatimonadota bacterium]MDW8028181.1 DUF4258 domain-containing protein [Armatimonadota bacterium]